MPEEIRDARLELRLTQEEAAQIAGASEAEWDKWESPTWSDQYRLINGAAWDLFLKATNKKRPKDSRFYISPPGKRPQYPPDVR
jgi:transcriptional regulator with XRE-family HTH domain